jgi:histidinol-phosphatase (PHP family)
VELGLNEWNMPQCRELLSMRDFDFVIGSVHYADGYDPYNPKYWEGKTVEQAYMRYLEKELECVKLHDDFDVLGHLTYVCKSPSNPFHAPLPYEECSEISDEIMRVLISRGKGIEVNTSGVDRIGDFLPSIDYIKRFRELGGEIVTVGSDAHTPDRVGQYTNGAIEIAKEVFGYVCTFEKRKPIFHKL